MVNFLSVEMLVLLSVMCGPGLFLDLKDGTAYS